MSIEYEDRDEGARELRVCAASSAEAGDGDLLVTAWFEAYQAPLFRYLLRLVGDGRRLVAGQTIQGIPGTDTACEIRVFDTSNGAEVGRFRYEQPLFGFALDRSGNALYAVIGGLTSRTIVEFGLPDGVVQGLHDRPAEQINRLLVGE